MLSYAIEPKSRGDEDKINQSMHRLEEEDPTIRYARDPQTHELLLAGQGQLHIEVTVAKLKRRFGVEVNLKPPRIPYRETITAKAEAHGRHKKQTGGHGQFGDCKIRMEPLPRGSEFEFVDEIFGGSIPRQFIPAVEKGIQESRLRGYLAGYPVVDFRVVLVDGQYHDVDSNELSFKTAGWLAFKDGMSKARPTLLEPIMNVEVYAPSDYAGDLMGDLNGRRGRIGGMEPRGLMTVIKRAGADGGDADLRTAPHVSDRRTRLVSHGVLALRRSARRTSSRRSSRRRRRSADRRWRSRRRSRFGAERLRSRELRRAPAARLQPSEPAARWRRTCEPHCSYGAQSNSRVAPAFSITLTISLRRLSSDFCSGPVRYSPIAALSVPASSALSRSNTRRSHLRQVGGGLDLVVEAERA